MKLKLLERVREIEANLPYLSNLEINKLSESISKECSLVTDAMIAAGRGHERYSETSQKDDELSLYCRAGADLRASIRYEKERRMGSAWSGSLPTGRMYGPRLRRPPEPDVYKERR